jgi:hypothetical protein
MIIKESQGSSDGHGSTIPTAYITATTKTFQSTAVRITIEVKSAMKHFRNFVQDRNVLIVCCSLKNGSHRGQLMMTTYIACSSGQCDPNSATACTGRIRSLGNKYDSYHSGRTPHAGRQATSKLLKIGFRVAIFRQNETHIKNSSRHADSYTIVIEGKSKCRDILCESLA